MGERAGCAQLEELAGMLTLVNQARAYRVEGLSALCQSVAEAAGRPIPANPPLVGSAIFTCETGSPCPWPAGRFRHSCRAASRCSTLPVWPKTPPTADNRHRYGQTLT